jgi:hypothetical protein
MTSSNKHCPNNEKLIIVEPIPINCGWQNLTVNHAKYFAHELTKRCASDGVEQHDGQAIRPGGQGDEGFPQASD